MSAIRVPVPDRVMRHADLHSCLEPRQTAPPAHTEAALSADALTQHETGNAFPIDRGASAPAADRLAQLEANTASAAKPAKSTLCELDIVPVRASGASALAALAAVDVLALNPLQAHAELARLQQLAAGEGA